MNDSWPNSEVLPAETANDTELPDALSSLTICFVGEFTYQSQPSPSSLSLWPMKFPNLF